MLLLLLLLLASGLTRRVEAQATGGCQSQTKEEGRAQEFCLDDIIDSGTQTARQSDSQTVRQPDSQTARQSDSQTARQPDSRPDSQTGQGGHCIDFGRQADRTGGSEGSINGLSPPFLIQPSPASRLNPSHAVPSRPPTHHTDPQNRNGAIDRLTLCSSSSKHEAEAEAGMEQEAKRPGQAVGEAKLGAGGLYSTFYHSFHCILDRSAYLASTLAPTPLAWTDALWAETEKNDI